ncbi:MAG TPA: dienelactone hydrolase family protein [Pirellulales bacterium]|nr:dienelactone hydrolase family protein [Pirellulales bacterium]
MLSGARPVARDVPWLADAQRPPETPAPNAPVLAPLLVDHGRPIDSLDAWLRRRAEIRQAWFDFLKPLAEPRDKPALKVLEEDHPAGCVRQLVQYESEPGETVEGYLLKPEPCPDKRPGVVVLHPTTPHTIREPAGFEGDRYGAFGLKLAERGLVAFCPRCFLWRGTENRLDRVAEHERRHAGSKGMAKMLWDAGRGLDVLESLDQVDGKRLGAVGHSLGAKETPSTDDGDRSWPFVAAALPVYKLYGGPQRVGLLNHRRGHVVPPDAAERSDDWLQTYLS